jgi:hypothetical protein
VHESVANVQSAATADNADDAEEEEDICQLLLKHNQCLGNAIFDKNLTKSINELSGR